MAKLCILAWFLRLEKKLSLFIIEYDVSDRLTKYTFLCWRIFPVYLICWEVLSWKDVELCQTHSVNMMYHVYWYCNVTPLHPRDEFHLIAVCDSINGLLNSVCKHLVEDFLASMFFRNIGLEFSSLVFFWFWYQSTANLIKWVWKCFFLFDFLEEFKDWYSSLKVW